MGGGGQPAGTPATGPGVGPVRLEAIYEAPGLPGCGLPRGLAERYGGDLGFEPPSLYANFVASLDGVVALGTEYRLPPGCTVLALGDGPALAMAGVLAAVSARGHASVLTEGGPALLGQLVGEGLVDELFLTVSPFLAGRDKTPRPGLVEGLELLPSRRLPGELLSARRRGSYLFLRYKLRR
ncbi:MAG: RibD family protein [Acidimicrobiales bacterium]